MDEETINVRPIEKCCICHKEFKQGDEVISLCLYDEEIGPENKTYVKEAYHLTAYHKKCSPVKIVKEIYEMDIHKKIKKGDGLEN